MGKKRRQRSLRGSLLIASPRLRDPNFVRTVVLVVQHDKDGAFGFVLNRRSELPIADLWSAIAKGEPAAAPPEGHAHFGGPVETGALLVVHGDEEFAGEQAPIVPGVYLTNDVAILQQLVANGSAGPLRFYLGYAGWGAGQLDGEVAGGDWLIAPAQAEHVFRADPDDLWRLAMEMLGGVYRIMALMPMHPELN